MLIGPHHPQQDVKIVFKLSYWSTQWLFVSALPSPSTITHFRLELFAKQECIPVGCVPPAH